MEGNKGDVLHYKHSTGYFVLFVLRLSFAEIIRVGDDGARIGGEFLSGEKLVRARQSLILIQELREILVLYHKFVAVFQKKKSGPTHWR